MKRLFTSLALLILTISQAQIVNIPDSNFKTALLSANSLNLIARDTSYNWMVIDINNDGQIQESEAQNVAYLYLNDRFISSLSGIDKFPNLLYLDCVVNNISSVDLSSNESLEVLHISNNNLSSLNIDSNIYLKELFCANNNLSNLNVNLNVDLLKLFCNNNSLGNLNLNSNIDLTNLDCSSNAINTIDLSFNTNLTSFNYNSNNSSAVNISMLTNLITLNCSQNNITTLDLSNNLELRYLFCNANLLNTLDCSNNSYLINLSCNNNNLMELDLSSNASLNQLKCGNNTSLAYINLKNGNNDLFVFGSFSDFEVLPNLNTVCVDELNSNLVAFIDLETSAVINYTEYCSLSPVNRNEINGIVKVDENLNGCSTSNVSMPNKLIVSNNGTDSYGTFTQENGDYLIYTNEGTFNTSLTANLPSYVSATPNMETNTFIGFGNSFTADFCIVPTQTVHDVSVSLIPINQARPGFVSKYRIVYTNNGTTQANGYVTLFFDEVKLSYQSSNPSENSASSDTIVFNYENLNPFETRIIDVEFQVFSPPVTNIDDELSFSASINSNISDTNPNDNLFILDQKVIGSYDPNDIHILEGTQIMFSKKDNYLHYVIRFQNTGTADAINVVVKNILDDKLDWSSLVLETTSHQSRVAIKNGNKVEFIFENIHLPDSTNDEQNSHGFIAYKIKPVNSIVINELIPNKANIYFDLNIPIETNTAATKYVNTLSVNSSSAIIFSVYPSPTSNLLHIETRLKIVQVEIFSKLGQLVLLKNNSKEINISKLSNAVYFCKITDENGNVGVQKIIKR